MKPTFAVIGCGRAGLAFSKHLAAAGYIPAGFASRSIASARHAADITGFAGVVSTRPGDVTAGADIVFVTTPDGAIREVAEEMAQEGTFRKEAVVCHCSGALSSAELSPLAHAGLKTASIHPLQSFSAESTGGNPFAGIMAGIEGDREAVVTARQVAADLGAHPFEIETRGKMCYHAAAVVASNYLVTLMKAATDLLAAAGVPPDTRFEILKPLIMGTLSNIENAGSVNALTGPIARGDADVVRAHVEALAGSAPEMLSLYKVLGRYTIEIAAARDGISGKTRRELADILKE